MQNIDFAEAALFLDFDGTLVRLEATPDAVVLRPRTRSIVTSLAGELQGAVAIISGRDVRDLLTMVAPLLVPLAGGHGAQTADSDGNVSVSELDSGMVGGLFDAISPYAARNGLLLERKAAGVALHFRNRPELEEEARAFAARLGDGNADLRVIQGNMVAELALAQVNKGNAIRSFMADAPFAGRVPIAAGDDTTDEDSFAAVQAMGGVGVKVGPGPTCARYRLPDVDGFVGWLATCLNAGSFRFKGMSGCN